MRNHLRDRRRADVHVLLRRLVLAWVLLLSGHASAQMMGAGGLVIDMHARGIQPEILDIDVEASTTHRDVLVDVLRVNYKNYRPRSIYLPAGSLTLIAGSEHSYARDELIISADNYLFGASPHGPYSMKGMVASKTEPAAKKLVEEYAREIGIDRRFALALLEYDGYAADVTCGAVPAAAPGSHPLAMDKQPPAVVARILEDPIQGDAFHKLFKSFSTPPACIGQLFLSYEAAAGKLPRVTVQARRWFIGYRWDRELIVLDETQSNVADAPYGQLSSDMQNRWDRYRETFRSLDELSSIVEALVVLRTSRTKNPRLYQQLQQRIASMHGPSWTEPRSGPILQKAEVISEERWHRRVRAQIGMYIEDEADAEIVLALQMYRWERQMVLGDITSKFDYPTTWRAGMALYEKNIGSLIASKIKLVRALDTEPATSLPLFESFFETVHHQLPDGLGLWLQSLHWLQIYNQKYPNMTNAQQELLKRQRTEALLMVNKRIDEVLKEARYEPAVATRFLGIAFGVRLFDLAIMEWPAFDLDGLNSYWLEQQVASMAEIHRWSIRGMTAHNPDRMILLTHHRYLGYLADKVPGAASRIEDVRKEIWRSLDHRR